MKIKNNFGGHIEHYYISDDDFMLNYTPYEHDEVSGRYYYLEPSVSMTSKAGREDGLARRRISKTNYEVALAECKTRLAETFKEQEEKPHEELRKNAASDKLRNTADRIEKKVPTVGAFVPIISAEDMIADFDQELRQQLASPCFIVNPKTAAHELYGFKLALKELGILEPEKSFVNLDHFGGIKWEAYSGEVEEEKKHRNGRVYVEEYKATQFGVFEERPDPYDTQKPIEEIELVGAKYIGGDLYVVPMQVFKTASPLLLKLAFLVADLSSDWTGSFAEINGANIRTGYMTYDGKLLFNTGAYDVGPVIDLRPEKKLKDKKAAEKLTRFLNLPPEKRDSGTNPRIYELGLILAKDCPENDCRLFLNIFNICRELDEQVSFLRGWPREVVEIELRRKYFELEGMFMMNYAIRQYRCNINPGRKKEPPDEQTAPQSEQLPYTCPNHREFRELLEKWQEENNAPLSMLRLACNAFIAKEEKKLRG